MAVIRHVTFDTTVNTISDRNAITNKVNHMTVLVKDAISDINAGSGKATYRWDEGDGVWILISKSNTDTVSFITEELTILNNEVVLSNYPMNNAIWNAIIINNNIIQGDLNLSAITIANGKITGIDSAYNGQKLRVTYAYGSIVSQLNTVITETVNTAISNANLGGGTSNVDLTAVNTDIIPVSNGLLSIGSETNRFKSIYVNEAYLSTNTLYIGDTPVLGTDLDTITVKADIDQSLLVKTSGTGSTIIQSAQEVQMSTNGMNADVKIQATGINSKVRLGGQGGIEFSSPVTSQSDHTVNGNLTVTGNIVHNGLSFVTNAATVTTKDNIIILNQGEVGTGVTAGKAGIQIDRGEDVDYQLIFNESIDKFTVGTVGGTHEVLATKEYVDPILANKVDKVIGKQLSTEDYTSLEKTKLAGIENNANNYVLPTASANGLGGIKIGAGLSITNGVVSVNAGGTADSVNWTGVIGTPTTLAGYGITDAAASTHIHTNATTTTAGFMSTTDKTKLDGIASGAQVNVPTDLSLGTATATVLPLNSSTGTDVILPAVTTTTAGLMISTDKVKLDGLSNYNKPSAEPISYITGLQTALDSKATTTALDVEKGRIDAILNASTADKDTFAEIVTLINSVDTTNDTTFSGYVTSNNARSTTIETTLGNKVDIVLGKGLSTEDYTTAEKTKLSGIASGAQVNVPTDLSLGTATATVLPLNSSTGTDVNLPSATTSTAGLLSATDKTKLDGVAANANNYVLPNASSTTFGGVKVNATAQTVAANAVTTTASRTYAVQLDASGNALVNVPWSDTVYTHPTSGVTAGTYKSVTVNSAGHVTAGTNPTTLAGYGITDAAASTHIHTNATTTVAGFMSTTDKTKLDGIAAGANNYVKPANEPISYITGLQTALDGKASTTYVDGRFTDLIGVAPAALDTLAELATQLNNDESAVSALTTTVAGKQEILVSGTNIKTINNVSIIGSGDITIAAGSKPSVVINTGSVIDIDIDITNQVSITGLDTNPTFNAPAHPTDGAKLVIRIKDNGISRMLSWNTVYRAMGVTIPTVTIANKTVYMGFIYNAIDGKWDCISVTQGV